MSVPGSIGMSTGTMGGGMYGGAGMNNPQLNHATLMSLAQNLRTGNFILDACLMTFATSLIGIFLGMINGITLERIKNGIKNVIWVFKMVINFILPPKIVETTGTPIYTVQIRHEYKSGDQNASYNSDDLYIVENDKIMEAFFWFLSTQPGNMESGDLAMKFTGRSSTMWHKLRHFNMLVKPTRPVVIDDYKIIVSEDRKEIEFSPMIEEEEEGSSRRKKKSNNLKETIHSKMIKIESEQEIPEIIKFIDKIWQSYLKQTYPVPEEAVKEKHYYVRENGENNIYTRFLLETRTTFDHVFFPDKDKLMRRIDRFMDGDTTDSKMTILLHGPPGGGKTSFIRALHDYTGFNVVVVKLDQFSSLKQLVDTFHSNAIYDRSGMQSGWHVPIKERIYLLEDVDAADRIVLRRTGQAEKRWERYRLEDEAREKELQRLTKEKNKKKRQKVQLEKKKKRKEREIKALQEEGQTAEIRKKITALEDEVDDLEEQIDDLVSDLSDDESDSSESDSSDSDSSESDSEETSIVQTYSKELKKDDSKNSKKDSKNSKKGSKKKETKKKNSKKQKETKKDEKGFDDADLNDLFGGVVKTKWTRGRHGEWEKGEPEITLSDILNILDGVLELPGCFVVMTTNHPEKLDPALIRPGRISYDVNLTYIKFIEMKMMITKFLPDWVDQLELKPIEIDDGEDDEGEVDHETHEEKLSKVDLNYLKVDLSQIGQDELFDFNPKNWSETFDFYLKEVEKTDIMPCLFETFVKNEEHISGVLKEMDTYLIKKKKEREEEEEKNRAAEEKGREAAIRVMEARKNATPPKYGAAVTHYYG